MQRLNEVLRIKRILKELNIPNPLPMKVYYDNKVAISIRLDNPCRIRIFFMACIFFFMLCYI